MESQVASKKYTEALYVQGFPSSKFRRYFKSEIMLSNKKRYSMSVQLVEKGNEAQFSETVVIENSWIHNYVSSLEYDNDHQELKFVSGIELEILPKSQPSDHSSKTLNAGKIWRDAFTRL